MSTANCAGRGNSLDDLIEVREAPRVDHPAFSTPLMQFR
jgi:hypothetical protein